jgi:uncharacterized protein YndB with AHSA1/START domain
VSEVTPREPADPVSTRTFRLLTPACPERVWSSLTCPRQSPRFLHGLSVYAEWAPGARILLQAPGCPPLQGSVLHVDPPQLLSYTLEDTGSGTCTYLTWSLRATERGTVVRLQVEEAGAGTAAGELDEVWLPVLDRLAGLLAL